MPELPRLDDLIGLAVDGGHDPDWIFNNYPQDRRVRKRHEKAHSLPLFVLFILEPARPANGKVRAGWKGNHQIECGIAPYQVFNIPLEMIARAAFACQEVTRPSIMSPCPESVPHNPAKLAGNQYPQCLTPTVRFTNPPSMGAAFRWILKVLLMGIR